MIVKGNVVAAFRQWNANQPAGNSLDGLLLAIYFNLPALIKRNRNHQSSCFVANVNGSFKVPTMLIQSTWILQLEQMLILILHNLFEIPHIYSANVSRNFGQLLLE